jgi:D-sedoheptulose 7-phosphate isomerase
MMDNVQKLFGDSEGVEDFARGYFDYVGQVTRSIDVGEIEGCVSALLKTQTQGRTVYVIGNGGSASTASHFANDLAIGTRSIPRHSVVSLVDNVSILTAVGNDYSFDDVFVRQLQLLANPGDLLLAISVSGNSPNIMNAVDWANENGVRTMGWTGFDGGELRKRAHAGVHVPTVPGEYGPAEDAHMLLTHLVCGYLFQAEKAKGLK